MRASGVIESRARVRVAVGVIESCAHVRVQKLA